MNGVVKHILVSSEMTIRDAMQVMNSAPRKGAPSGIVVVAEKGVLKGIICDGDVRRAFIDNIDLDRPVSEIMNKDPLVFDNSQSDDEILSEVTDLIRKKKFRKISHLIIVDKDRKVHDVYSIFELWKHSHMKTRNVCVVGLGYVGLTLAVTYCDVGFDVYGIEPNKDVVAGVRKNQAHFHEVGLNPLIERYLDNKLFISEKLEDSMSDIYFIAVGTPVDENKNIIMDYVKSSSESVAKVLKRGDLVVLRSTVPVGTCRDVVLPILEKESRLKAGEDFHLVFAPERTVEGNALRELRELPQVIGGLTKACTDLAANLFREITPTVVIANSIEAAEMVKLVNNTYRDVKFGFSNELAMICDSYDIDTVEMINAANQGYPRDRIPLPSPGVGGPCLTKDPFILAEVSRKKKAEANIALSARKANERMPAYVASKAQDFFKKHSINKPKIFIVGFAFKGRPETSDIRSSPTIDVVKNLQEAGYDVLGYDPVASKADIESYGVKHCSLKDGFRDADAVLVLNNHESYEKWDLYSLVGQMKKPSLFFDAWHMFQATEVENAGVTYGCLGGIR